MIFRSPASLRVAVSFAALLVLSACSDDRQAQLSAVETIDIPAGNAGAQQNQNIANPTLEIPVTYPIEEGDELTLVWSEEFDGPEIDPGTWFFATGDGTEVGLPGGWGNNELQYYLPDNAMIVNGVLEITARRETVGNLNYTSARINTQDRFAFKYGRIEASMKLPGGQGLWPAFWMLSQDSDYLCSGDPCVWAAIGEIDIVEAVNLDGTGGNEIFATIHYGDEFPANQSTETRFTPSVDVTETFNTYALEWDEDEIRWYFNGELYAEQPSSAWFSAADNAGPNGPFDQNFHVLLNLAVGGNFPGSPDGTTPWPVTMEVDWVRVYSGEPPPADAGDVPENAVFVTDPNVTAGLAAPILDNFGSGATFNQFYAGDPDFKPTLQVISGNAYEGNPDVGFVAFAGYDAGFAADFETLSFKVKGLPGDELEIKFFGSPENSIIINLGTYTGAVDIGNGWYQVTIPMSDFAVNVYAFTGFLIGPPGDQGSPFSFLLTDIGFNGTVVTAPAAPGTTPDVTLYSRGAATDLVFGEDYFEIAVFGSGAIASNNNTGDVDFSPAFSVTTGFGYEKWNAQLAFLGFDAGFASSYETLDFKVKGMAGDVIRVKLLNDPDPEYVDVDLTGSDYATSLGNGWYQVLVPIADIPGDVATAVGLLFETIEPAPDAAFTFLLNDIGFSRFEMADSGTTPEFVLFGTTAEADVPIPENGPQNFGSGASFDFAFADRSFDPVISVTAGSGYSPPLPAAQDVFVGFLAVTGYTAGFTDTYNTFNVKVKGSPLGTVEVKLLGAPGEEGVNTDSVATVDVTTYVGSTDLGDGWYELNIPFSEFSNPENIPNHTGWLVGPPGDQADEAFVFLLTDVGFSNAAGGAGDNFIVNGGFESGDFSNWETTPGGGTQDVITDNPSSGIYAAKLTVPVRSQTDPAVDNLLKAVNLQAGNLTPGETVTISFDMRGSVSTGGDVLAEFFSEKSVDGASKSEILGGGPLVVNTEWTNYSFSTTLGDDVSGGVSLLLKASCGPVEGCTIDVYFDNVSIVRGGDGSGGSSGGGGGSGGGSGGGGPTGSCGGEGELAINCGFETGQFNDGTENASWQQFPGGGIQEIVTENPSSGTYAAHLVVPIRTQTDAAMDNLIKNANLQPVTAGASITVSFDMRGSLSGAGGVVIAELFSELSGGGTSASEILGGAALEPTSDWAGYSFTTTLGSDVSGGVTLQLKSSCGPVEGCGVDVFFDNVSIKLD